MDLGCLTCDDEFGGLHNFMHEFKFQEGEYHRETKDWEVIKCTADSGAADNVGPEGIAKMFSLQESDASRNGRYYTTANGGKVPNKGEKKLDGVGRDGRPLRMTMQVAPINKVLTSVGKACDAGNVVLFTKDGGYIVKAPQVQELVRKAESLKDKVTMKREKGMYTYELFMRKPKGKELHAMNEVPISTHNRYAALDEESLFIRQGRQFTGRM